MQTQLVDPKNISELCVTFALGKLKLLKLLSSLDPGIIFNITRACSASFEFSGMSLAYLCPVGELRTVFEFFIMLWEMLEKLKIH